MSLSDTAIRNAKPTEKPYKMPDEKGMYLFIHPNGGKYFRLDYRFDGKRKTLALGVYPEISLKQARDKRDEAKKQITDGIDPGEIRKQGKAEKAAAIDRQNRLDAGLPVLNSFEHVARDWLESAAHTVRELTRQKKIRHFERHVFPGIGAMDVAEIKSPDIYGVIKPLIAKNQLETAHRVHSEISSVYSYAIAHGFTNYDPAQAVAAQIPAQKVKHRAALTDPKEIGQLLRDIYSYQGTFVVQCAFRLSPLLFQRPGEIRQMEWDDIDLEAREWRYFVTKTEVLHIVPLSKQAVSILEEIKPLTGSGRYVFPSSRGDGRPMSDNTIRTALKTLGYDSDVMTAHGFRTTASTLLNEQGWSPDAIERQLCHMPRDAVRAAYNRAQYLEERRKMMQAWSDYLDSLKAGADVIPLMRKNG
ncbi:integrase arm-type DNA-binding domain-containing protein [Methylobacter sp. Wu1]|uniref:tyrosine-type recombinase/integrase n=1 Tax=Methylobacter sp. Wu1 TaxID=3119359 RepID=UPI002F93B113